jgi:hypothetical protein
MKKQILFLVSISSLIFNYGFAGMLSDFLFELKYEKPTWPQPQTKDDLQRKDNWHNVIDQFNRVDDANRFPQVASFFDYGDNYRAVISLPDYTKKIIEVGKKRQKLYGHIAANYPDHKEAICNKMKREKESVDQFIISMSRKHSEELEHCQRLKMIELAYQ